MGKQIYIDACRYSCARTSWSSSPSSHIHTHIYLQLSLFWPFRLESFNGQRALQIHDPFKLHTSKQDLHTVQQHDYIYNIYIYIHMHYTTYCRILCVYMYVYIYIYIYMYVCVCACIYIYIYMHVDRSLKKRNNLLSYIILRSLKKDRSQPSFKIWRSFPISSTQASLGADREVFVLLHSESQIFQSRFLRLEKKGDIMYGSCSCQGEWQWKYDGNRNDGHF